MSLDPLLVVLDLDETLVHACPYGQLPNKTPDFHVGHYPVYKRPGVDYFLDQVLDEFEVAVWTSATPLYAEDMVDQLFSYRKDELHFVWASDKCTMVFDPRMMTQSPEKRLSKVKKLGFNLDRVLAVDDTPEKYAKNYGNLVKIPEYLGEDEDYHLENLMHYLRKFNEETNVRKVEKRGWYNDVHS